MAVRTRQELLDEVQEWRERAETAEEKLEQITAIASEDEDEAEDDGEDEDEE